MGGLAVPKRLRGVKGTAHAHAPKQERRTALRLGGSTIKGSGSGDVKADVRVKRVLRIECKCTTAKSFSVTLDMLRKIEEAALASGELPAIEIEFLGDKGKVIGRAAVLPAIAIDMLRALREDTDAAP